MELSECGQVNNILNFVGRTGAIVRRLMNDSSLIAAGFEGSGSCTSTKYLLTVVQPHGHTRYT